MSVFNKPAATVQILEEYLVIEHLDNLSIVRSPEGKKYYARLDAAQQPKGTYIDGSLLRRITELPQGIQQRIINEF